MAQAARLAGQPVRPGPGAGIPPGVFRARAGGRRGVPYGGGCAGFLSRAGAKVVHLGNLIFEPQTAMAGKSPVAKAPFTYVNRLRLKSWFKRSFAA